MPTKTQQASEFKKFYQVEAQKIMEDENAKNKKDHCNCEARATDDVEKKVIGLEIQASYEEIIQLE